jgi:excisionase family DNA binding protein
MGVTKTIAPVEAAAASGRKAFSPDEAASVYGVGRNLIYEQIAAGNLKARKAGARTLIAAADLAAWFEALPPAAKAKRHATA